MQLLFIFFFVSNASIILAQSGCLIDVPFTVSNEVCVNGDNGSITLSSSMINLTYLWSNGATTPAISNLGDGTYIVTITAPNGCDTILAYTIDPGISPSISGDVIACNPLGTTYTLSFNINSGLPPYIVSGVPGTMTSNHFVSSPIGVSSLPPVYATDANGCNSATYFPSVSCASSGLCSAIGCFANNLFINGSFETFDQVNPFSTFTSDYSFNGPCASGANGCGNYICAESFAVANSLTPCNPTWSNAIHDHTSGTGNMMVVDFPSTGNSKIWSKTITLPANKDYCFGAWIINLLETGSNLGLPSFAFKVNGVTTYSSPGIDEDEQWHFYGAQFNSLSGGSFNLSIYNLDFGSLGYDVAIDDIMLRQIINGNPPITLNDTAYICEGIGNVTIDVANNDNSSTGAINLASLQVTVPPPFTQGAITFINLTNGFITFTPSAAFSGIAHFKYKLCDNFGCCSDAQVSIIQVSQPVITITPQNPSVCLGTPLTLTASGAASYYWYANPEIDFENNGTIICSPSTLDTFTVVGSNLFGCVSILSIIVPVYTVPVISVAPLSSIICNDETVLLSANGSLNFQWSPSASLSSATSGNVTAAPHTTTSYTVIGFNNSGCADTAYVDITVNQLPNLSITPNVLNICEDDTAMLTASGCTNYIWTPDIGISATNTNAVNIYPSVTTTYFISGSDNNNCADTASIVVGVVPVPVAQFNIITPVCAGTLLSFTNLSTNNNLNDWDFDDDATSIDLNPTHTYNDSGTFTTQLIASSAPGCSDTTTRQIKVSKVAQVSGSYMNDYSVLNTKVYIETIDAEACYVMIGDSIYIPASCDSGFITFDFPAPGYYSALLVATNASGCNDTTSISIYVDDVPLIYVPNAFSPNGDGRNDVFNPHFLKDFSSYSLIIYNRWGQNVFETNYRYIGWNGMLKANNQAAIGLYVWVISYSLIGSTETKTLHGTVALLK